MTWDLRKRVSMTKGAMKTSNSADDQRCSKVDQTPPKPPSYANGHCALHVIESGRMPRRLQF